jgi:hypothetical protein
MMGVSAFQIGAETTLDSQGGMAGMMTPFRRPEMIESHRLDRLQRGMATAL